MIPRFLAKHKAPSANADTTIIIEANSMIASSVK